MIPIYRLASVLQTSLADSTTLPATTHPRPPASIGDVARQADTIPLLAAPYSGATRASANVHMLPAWRSVLRRHSQSVAEPIMSPSERPTLIPEQALMQERVFSFVTRGA